MDASQGVRRVRQTSNGTANPTRKVDGTGETPLEGIVPQFTAQGRNFRPRQEQRHGHYGHNHHKLNEEEHQNHPNDDFHVSLPTGRRPDLKRALRRDRRSTF
jgi:hypothetical protein